MKTPIVKEADIVILCTRKSMALVWKAELVDPKPDKKMTAESTGSASAAARNLALRFFWGGNTKAFVGEEEIKALRVAPGVRPGIYLAWIEPGNDSRYFRKDEQ